MPRKTVTVDLLEHWVPGGLCARAALGWILGGPAYCSGFWGFQFQFLPPNLEEQCHAFLVPSVHISGSMLLHMQKVGQVLPELVAGGTRQGRGFKVTVWRKLNFFKAPRSYRNSICWTWKSFQALILISVAVCRMLNSPFSHEIVPELGSNKMSPCLQDGAGQKYWEQGAGWHETDVGRIMSGLAVVGF